MDKRNVLVIGGSRGVGLAIAKRLAADGFRVFALARKESAGLKAAIAAQPLIGFVPYDLLEIDGIPDLVRELKAEHGPFYGLVNNAALGTEGLLANMHNSDIEKLVRLNTLSPIILTKYVAARHDDGGRGPHRQYRFHRGGNRLPAGLRSMAPPRPRCWALPARLAREVGRLGVTVNAVAPGFMETEMTASLSARAARQDRRPQRPQAAGGCRRCRPCGELSDERWRARNVTGHECIDVDAGT